MSEPIHIISLGAGVQSSTMALMAAAGRLTPMPVAAVFADTQAEPTAVYHWLDQLEKILPFPIRRVSKGNIEQDFLRLLGGGAERSRCGQPPFYVRQRGTDDEGGTLWRQCTKDYKLEPIRREVRRLMKENEARNVVQWIGISLDEAHRMKTSGVKFIRNHYPLIDERMARHDCVHWLIKNGFPVPAKSACRWCPYKSNANWRAMRIADPYEFRLAVDFDRALRSKRANRVNGVKITGELFVHRSCVPLDEVDLQNDVDRGQGELFGNDCEGVCGV